MATPKFRQAGVRGIDSYCPFVFLLLFFVSSFFPASAPGGPSALPPPLPSPHLLCDSLLLSHFLHCWLFSWAFVFPCLVSVFMPLCFPPLLFPVAAAAPAWAGWLP